MDETNIIEAIYSDCITHISTGDIVSYRETLSLIPLADLEMDDQKETLLFFLTVCHENKRLDAVVQTFEIFDDANPMSDTRPTFTTFFVSVHGMDLDFVRFVASAFPEIELYDIMLSLLHYEGTDEIIQTCVLAESCYGVQDVEVYKTLLSDIQYFDTQNVEYNDNVLRYIERVLMDMEISRARPEWIVGFNGSYDDLVAFADTIKPSYSFHPNDSTLTAMIDRATLIDTGVPDEDISQKLSELSIDEHEKLRDMYAKTREQLTLAGNEELTRIFGPSYPHIGISTLSATSDDPCDRYGGCRMLLCLGHDEDFTELGPVESEGRPDWFTGYCDVCMAYISKRHYACRAIGIDGGYRGCFCSREHARTLIDPTNLVQVEAMNEIERKIDAIGIYDRTYEEVKFVSRVEDSGMTFEELADYF